MATPDGFSPVTRTPLSLLVSQQLRHAIVSGDLPVGSELPPEGRLAERFGVSPTPIREALITLAGMGIVDLVPNRGAVVRRVTAQEVRDVCQVRKALECEAARSACGRIDLAELKALAAELRRLMAARPDRGDPDRPRDPLQPRRPVGPPPARRQRAGARRRL